MPKRVWILGAGASKEMGYPLGGEMLAEMDAQLSGFIRETVTSEGLSNLRQKYESSSNDENRTETEEEIKAYLEERKANHKDGPLLSGLWGAVRLPMIAAIFKFYGHRNLTKIDYEDFFTRIRLVQNGLYPKLFEDEEKKWGKYALKLEENLTRMLHWLGMRLNHAMDFNGEAARRYEEFVKSVNPRTDVVVSFNTDSLLERTLVHRGNEFVYPGSQIKFEHGKINIIKPHGSFDWVYVKRENESDMQKNPRLITIEYDDEKWKNDPKVPVSVCLVEDLYREQLDGNNERPGQCCIMPPDAFKGMPRNGVEEQFINLYNLGLEQVQKADEVIIVGFAVRPTDVLAGTWLNLGLRSKKADQVFVVDPADKVPEGISKNIKEFTYIQKPFLKWVAEGGLEELPEL